MTHIKIRRFNKNELIRCVELVKKTYLTCNKFEGSKEAVKRYADRLDSSDKDKLKSFCNAQIFYVAENEEGLVGLIKGRPDRIGNLFVLPEEQGKGIGRLLVETFEKKCEKYGTETIRIRSSLYAVKFYERMGYKKSTGIRNFHGLKIQPMIKTLH